MNMTASGLLKIHASEVLWLAYCFPLSRLRSSLFSSNSYFLNSEIFTS